MTRLPEIDPEIRGLLEEIASSPRSSMRLAPRQALRRWFTSDEPVRPGEVARTRAERHLVEAHREALAQLLWEAAYLAFWQAPRMSHWPRSPDGRRVDMGQARDDWRRRAEARVQGSGSLEGSPLLQACFADGHVVTSASLAAASLKLAPSDRTRYWLALCLPPSQERTAIELLERLSVHVRPVYLRAQVELSLAARLSRVERLEEARSWYAAAERSWPESPLADFYSFNLACACGDFSAACDWGARIGDKVAPSDARLEEAKRILTSWLDSRSPVHARRTREQVMRVSSRVPEAAQALAAAYVT